MGETMHQPLESAPQEQTRADPRPMSATSAIALSQVCCRRPLVPTDVPDISSTTLLKWLYRRAETLRAQDVQFMLTGVDDQTARALDRSGVLERCLRHRVLKSTGPALVLGWLLASPSSALSSCC